MSGWIKMLLGMKVGQGPGHTVLDADPTLPPPQKKGGRAPNFQPFAVVRNGWMIKMPLVRMLASAQATLC